ncbi:hypothetical protein IJH72_01680 [Candidatus Saccharibacteria bacterium]|nr:hypothetical protein [Candidatus Saccharibacteria bacterium]
MDNGQSLQTDDKAGELLQFPQNNQNGQASWDIQQNRDPRNTGSSVLNSSVTPEESLPGEGISRGAPSMSPEGDIIQFRQAEPSEIGQIINMEMPPGAEQQNSTSIDGINASAEAPKTSKSEAGEPEILDKKEEHSVETIEKELDNGAINLEDYYDRIRDIVEEQNSSERKVA